MSRYVIAFSKTGIICYTSHLDLMRIFKRAFRRAGIPLAYSQGFNPHPKMGFAQPLSLGYWSVAEYIEFEVQEEYLPNELMVRLAEGLPEGIELKECLAADRLKKTLSAHTVAAEYMIQLPAGGADGDISGTENSAGSDDSASAGQGGAPMVDLWDSQAMWHAYMDRAEIPAKKRQKRKKELKTVDIRPMIREITFMPVEDGGAGDQSVGVHDQGGQTLYIDVVLDSGSASNLSPELIVSSVAECFGLTVDRSAVSIMRKGIAFDRPLEQLLRGE